MIIEITDKAKSELKKIIESKNTNKPLRIFIASYGWGGPSFGLALDEPKDGDDKIMVDDFNFVIEDGISNSYGKFIVDYGDSWLRRGFTVTPDRVGPSC